MSIFSAFRVAFDALLVHKGRSCLTSLGIIIGIGAVIAMVSAAGAARTQLDERLENVGTNLILVKPGATTQVGAVADQKLFTMKDIEAIERDVGPLLAGVAPIQVTQRVATTRTNSRQTMITATTPQMQDVRSWKMQYGRFLTDEDLKKKSPVCVIGETVREELFPYTENPVGERLTAQIPLRIIGVLTRKGRNPTGGDQDDQIFVPITTFHDRIVPKEAINIILATPKTSELTDLAKAEITRSLRIVRGVKEGQDDFDVSSVEEMAAIAVDLTRVMQLLIGVIASISLVVGGIGIMNIMLVSVTERTREIGIRMAVGAKPRDILIQFLIESVTLALIGGVLGIVLGVGGAIVMAHFAEWPGVIDLDIVLLATAVSAGVGIFFGYYPALKASRLDPIEALRYE